jgi:hypothetical protein
VHRGEHVLRPDVRGDGGGVEEFTCSPTLASVWTAHGTNVAKGYEGWHRTFASVSANELVRRLFLRMDKRRIVISDGIFR